MGVLGRRVAEVFAHEQNALAYGKWLAQPETQMFLELVETSIRPLRKPESMPAERYGGLVDGRYEVLWLLTHLDDVGKQTEQIQNEVDLTADFGVSSLLSQWGVKKPADRPAANK